MQFWISAAITAGVLVLLFGVLVNYLIALLAQLALVLALILLVWVLFIYLDRREKEHRATLNRDDRSKKSPP